MIYGFHQNKRLYALNKQLFSVNSQLSAMNHQLKEADKVKEQYICRYLEVYSDYIRRLTTMARKAGEKDSAAFMDREMDNFYRSFDDTFLSPMTLMGLVTRMVPWSVVRTILMFFDASVFISSKSVLWANHDCVMLR